MSFLRFAVFLLVIALLSIKSYAQKDSTNYNIFEISPEVGLLFPSSNDFKDIYKSKSALNWGVGFKIGKQNGSFLPYAQYSQYKASIDSTPPLADTNNREFMAKRKQFLLGFVNPVLLKENHYLEFKIAVTYNNVTEQVSRLEGVESFGLVLSAGYIKKTSCNFNYFVHIGYDYAKTNSVLYFKDWGGLLVSYGISINLDTGETVSN